MSATAASSCGVSGESDSQDVNGKDNKATDPSILNARWTIIVFVCLLTFGSYYSFDLPSVMKKEIIEQIDLSDTEYNLLYSLYSWCNALIVLFGGVLIDKTSNGLGAIIFLICINVGQTILSIGTSTKIYALMLIGRLVFGAGGGPICVVQNSFAAVYFRGSELSLALGLSLTASRIECKLEDKRTERTVRFSDLKLFPIAYWLICAICALFYTNIFAFMAEVVGILEQEFDMEPAKASNYSAILYFVSIPASTLFGLMIDKIGHRVDFMIISALLLLPFDILFLANVSPAFSLVLAGFAYALQASALWSSIILLVPNHAKGSALGICTTIQMGTIGISNLVVGVIRDASDDFKNVMIFFIFVIVVTIAISLFLRYHDSSVYDSKLNNYRSGMDLPRFVEEESSPEFTKPLLKLIIETPKGST